MPTYLEKFDEDDWLIYSITFFDKLRRRRYQVATPTNIAVQLFSDLLIFINLQ
ncbi:MAG: hypothetical protein WBA93_22495 [Microcoleaceae cyanobacterium]